MTHPKNAPLLSGISSGQTSGQTSGKTSGQPSGIIAENLCSGYEGFRLRALSAAIKPGQMTALIGPNGCGKSTLIKTLARQIPALSGRVWLDGQPLARLRTKAIARQIAYLPQHPIAPPGITVAQLVAYGRAPHQNLLGFKTAEDDAHIAAALGFVSLSDLADSPLSDLSGGQRQRAFLAMCVAQDTPYVLLDEPTSYLDIKFQFDTLDLCRRLCAQGKTIVAVLHDISQAARYADQLLVMEDGLLVELGVGENYEGGPNRAIEEYFAAHPGVFEIDAYYCDMFGPNATYAPNGYMRKT